MITLLRTDNFKSLLGTEVPFAGNTMIVGDNASGKSSVLLALDLLISSVRTDFSSFLEELGLVFSDLLSHLSGSSAQEQICFHSEWQLPRSDSSTLSLSWELEVAASPDGSLFLRREEITDLDSGAALLSFSPDGQSRILKLSDRAGHTVTYPPLAFMSSALKYLAPQLADSLPELAVFREYLLHSFSCGILSPSGMRHSRVAQTAMPGRGGVLLPSLIRSMDPQSRRSLNERISRILDGRISEIDALKDEYTGQISLETVEELGAGKVRFASGNISDGVLRLAAILAVCEGSGPGLVLVDEIENGIHYVHSEELINLLREVCAEKHLQVVAATHNTVLLDFVEPESIVLLHRHPRTGVTSATSMAGLTQVKELEEFMFPGEILLNNPEIYI